MKDLTKGLRLEYVKFGRSGDWKLVSGGGTVVAVLNDNPYTQPRETGEAIVRAVAASPQQFTIAQVEEMLEEVDGKCLDTKAERHEVAFALAGRINLALRGANLW